MQMRSKILVRLVLAGAMLLGAGAAIAAQDTADWTTTLKVKLVLLEKLGRDSLHVEVDSVGGAVTLKGTVDKRETRELAETVAKSVESVRSVNNEVRLEASVENPNKTAVAAGEAEAEVRDAMLSTRIRLALVDKMGSDGFAIGTEVADGVVTLEIAKEFTAARRREATQIVEGVDGVTKVVSVDKK
jgi:hyperosmotically inducible periplasmic protein